MSDTKSVLVFGATGQQGGAVVDALLSQGHHIIGLTRNPDSEKAQKLVKLGVEVEKGNLNDAHELQHLMSNADAVFALTTPFEEGVEGETKQGVTAAQAAQQAGVKHFIFNSVSDADQQTGIPHFDSKYLVEKKIQELGLNYTILAPVYFMDNIGGPWAIEGLKSGKISLAMPADRVLQQITVKNIADFVAEVVTGGEIYFGKRYNIAGDELTGNQMAERLSSYTGRDFQYEGFDPEFLRESSEDMMLMYKWFDEVGYTADLESLKQSFPNINLQSFDNYIRTVDWRFV